MTDADLVKTLSKDPNSIILLNFLHHLDRAKSLTELFSCLESAANALGFEGVSYTYIPPVLIDNLESSSPIFLSSPTFSQAFIDHYEKANLGEHDFVIKRVLSGDLKSVHWWKEAENRRVDRQEKRVIEIARTDYGIENAISIPTYLNGDSVAGVSVTSSDKTHFFDTLFSERLSTLQQIARIFSDRVLIKHDYQSFFYKPFVKSLSETEKTILILLSKDLPLKSIAYDIGISYKYAGNLVERLRRKFGHVSRERLMYLAGLMNFHQL